METYQISDIIYALSFRLDKLHDDILQDLASKENKKDFINQVQFHFVTEYQKDLFTKTGIIDEVTLYDQNEIDKIFTEFSLFFHKHVKEDYFLNRGISTNEVNKYKLGSTHVIYNTEITKPFLDFLKNKYNTELVDKIMLFHLKAINSIKTLHNSEAFVTIPDFNNVGVCQGIVYRAERFEKTNGLRNFHKFFVSHAPSFWFNSECIKKYNTLIIVEGVFDALALLRVGILNVISPSSTRISSLEYKIIKNKNLHLIFDKDQGGIFGLELFFNEYDKEDRECYTTYDLLETEKDFDELTKEEIFIFLDKHQIKYYLE